MRSCKGRTITPVDLSAERAASNSSSVYSLIAWALTTLTRRRRPLGVFPAPAVTDGWFSCPAAGGPVAARRFRARADDEVLLPVPCDRLGTGTKGRRGAGMTSPNSDLLGSVEGC